MQDWGVRKHRKRLRTYNYKKVQQVSAFCCIFAAK